MNTQRSNGCTVPRWNKIWQNWRIYVKLAQIPVNKKNLRPSNKIRAKSKKKNYRLPNNYTINSPYLIKK